MSLERELFGADHAADERVRVLVADHDPISRHVLTSVLHRSPHLEVVGSVNEQQPLHQWPLERIDVVVLVSVPRENVTQLVRQLESRKVRVLLVGTTWSKRRLDAAFAAGATGCLVKNIQVAGLSAAIRAVASGHTVLSPELRVLYAQRMPVSSSAHTAGSEQLLHTLTSREREVLKSLAEGMSTAETAAQLHVSPATVKSHVSHALTKLGARNRLEAVLLFQRSYGLDTETVPGGQLAAMVG
ncbi:response regulator transcription factor [Streptomyces sp. B1I3]|uniref:response regulator transcription factor n=1 Tax=Streptomyces sp. B1I3 TaxID=3042264 RepID=UPI002788B812|nr:response regulator transcription factor [Streptomyces sp. B1I3]MDQ0794206.1 two-component system nitrate/nitrite response regulator NarL [Streptomyces sp. B1I3]